MKRMLAIMLTIVLCVMPMNAAASQSPAEEIAAAVEGWDITEPLWAVLEMIEMDYAYVYVQALVERVAFGDVHEALAAADLTADPIRLTLPVIYPDASLAVEGEEAWPAHDPEVGDPDVYAEELLYHAEELINQAFGAEDNPKIASALEVEIRRDNGVWTVLPDQGALEALANELVRQGQIIRETALHQPGFADALLLLEVGFLLYDEEFQKPCAQELDMRLEDFVREDASFSAAYPFGAETDWIEYTVTLSAKATDAADRERFTIHAEARWGTVVWMIEIDEKAIDEAAQRIKNSPREPAQAQEEAVMQVPVYIVPRARIVPRYVPAYRFYGTKAVPRWAALLPARPVRFPY